MPVRPKRPCARPGCGALVDAGYCERHRAPDHLRYDQGRESAARRGYGRRWRRLRLMILARDPICRCGLDGCDHEPERCARPSEHVDHVVPRARGGDDSEENLVGLCAPCHARKTVREDGGFGRCTGG